MVFAHVSESPDIPGCSGLACRQPWGDAASHTRPVTPRPSEEMSLSPGTNPAPGPASLRVFIGWRLPCGGMSRAPHQWSCMCISACIFEVILHRYALYYLYISKKRYIQICTEICTRYNHVHIRYVQCISDTYMHVFRCICMYLYVSNYSLRCILCISECILST